LREDAVLAVVFLGDQDDCSAKDDALFDPSALATLGPPGFRCCEQGVVCNEAIDRDAAQSLTGCRPHESSAYLTPIADFFDFFAPLRPAGRLVLATISGPYAEGDVIQTQPATVGPSCTGPGADDQAEPAVRLHDLVRRFGSDGVVLADLGKGGGICTDDFGPALDRIGAIIENAFRQRCIPGPLAAGTDEDLSEIAAAGDARCVVTDVVHTDRGEARLPLGRCDFADGGDDACTPPDASPGALAERSLRPCWYVCDSTGSERECAYGWELRICRDRACDPTTPAPLGAITLAQCLTCGTDTCGR
jgi:hypothetical protein